MPTYKAPLRDMRFLINEVFDFESHYKTLPNGEEATPDMVEAILGELAKLCENTIGPLYHSGDHESCKLEDGQVTTPKGYKEAYQEYVAGGWQGLSHPAEYGGQGLPMSLGLFKQEMMGTANWPFAMYPGLSLGAMNTIQLHGDEDQKATYLTPLTEGTWAGTMCLTEPQCGTDLGQVKTKAEPQADGSYKITGTKIFISSGDHDLTENIVHIVLARLPDAPKGTKGISLFIVPKYLPGKIGESNGVVCGSLEKKMGIKASATCVMNFDEATGFMIGEENKGLECMFTFMNSARIGTACQGIAHAELAYQGSLPYAKERRSMRALSGKKDPDAVADALIHHGDVRRMLLKQKAIAEGGRAMIYFAAQYADNMISGMLEDDQEKYDRWDSELGFLTPILKGFLTEKGLEVANDAMQIFGGHGYIKEHGMEQIVRDARIAQIYEGANGIQALDLVGRKLPANGGRAVMSFFDEVGTFVKENAEDDAMKPYVAPIKQGLDHLQQATMWFMNNAMAKPDNAGAGSVDYMHLFGLVALGYMWGKIVKTANAKLQAGAGDKEDWLKAKLTLATFFMERQMPETAAHLARISSGADTLMSLDADAF